MGKKKICFVNPTILLKRPIAQLAQKLDNDYEISVLAPRPVFRERNKSLHYSRLKKVDVRDYPVANLGLGSEWPVPGLRFFGEAWSALKNNDIVHIWVPFYCSSTSLVLMKRLFFRKKKLILTMDTIPGLSFRMGGMMDSLFRAYYKTVGKLVFSGADVITLYGESMKSYARKAGIPMKKVKITPTGTDLKIKKHSRNIRKEFGIGRDEKVVLFVGLLVERKGLDLVVETAEQLRGTGARFLIVGDGPSRKKYEWLVKKKGLKNVTFIGFRKDVHNFYNEADVFFLPSRGEGLPGVVMEAMAYGLPVVSSDTPCIPDLVKSGRTGYLCKLNNVEEFSKRIEELIRDEKKRSKMGAEGKKKIKEFSWGKAIENYEKQYK